ncbi:MAG: MFS transporter, partial [Solirubrobacterales bacterium]|nr:MFS transporter [Solirubrobacterales bacterium]
MGASETAEGGPRLQFRDAAAIALLSMGTSWGAGNVGPVVPDLESEFDFSLGSIGVLSGTLFLIGSLVGLAIAPKLAERVSVVAGMRAACLAAGIGSLLFAVGPGFLTLAVGRVIAGFGIGVGAALGPVFGRAVGGVKGVGIFGAAFQFGIGGGLATGSIVNDAGADWRITFVVSALMGFSALLFLRSVEIDFSLSSGGFFRSAVRSPSVYRLSLLFIAMFGAPLTLGAWLVHYLTV